MTNRERINRIKKSVHYFDLFDEKTFIYQVFELFANQSNQFFKKSIFNTRLNRMKQMLNIQNQIIQKKSYEFKIFKFSNFLLKHDIFDFESKNRKKDVKNSQKNEILDFHTFIRQSDFQITFSIIKFQRQSRHKHFYRRFIIKFEFVNQEIIIVKKNN